MNLDEFHIEEVPTDLDGARNFGTLTPQYGVLNRFSVSADVHAALMRNLVPQ